MTLSYKKCILFGCFSSFFQKCQKSVYKIVKRGSIFGNFRYRYALLQKIKNVLTYYEHIFDFLKKCVPITEIAENCVSVSGFSLKNALLNCNLVFTATS